MSLTRATKDGIAATGLAVLITAAITALEVRKERRRDPAALVKEPAGSRGTYR